MLNNHLCQERLASAAHIPLSLCPLVPRSTIPKSSPEHDCQGVLFSVLTSTQGSCQLLVTLLEVLGPQPGVRSAPPALLKERCLWHPFPKLIPGLLREPPCWHRPHKSYQPHCLFTTLVHRDGAALQATGPPGLPHCARTGAVCACQQRASMVLPLPRSLPLRVLAASARRPQEHGLRSSGATQPCIRSDRQELTGVTPASRDGDARSLWGHTP